MENEYRRIGKFKDSEFAFQTCWNAYRKQGPTLAYEPHKNPARC